jgi:transposase
MCEWDHVILNHTCSSCGETWDQDDNAAENIMESYVSDDGKSGVTTLGQAIVMRREKKVEAKKAKRALSAEV